MAQTASDTIEHEEVTSLRGWPEVGKTYLVAAIWAGYGWVPVFPDPHTDDELPCVHWHVDARFLPAAVEAFFAAQWPGYLANLRKLGVQREVVAELPLPIGVRIATTMGYADVTGDNPIRSVLRPMVCRYATIQWDGPPRDHYWNPKKYLPNAPRDGSLKAIRSSDGRPLCPHQKVDLTCVWDGQSSHVRCPLHGLLVDVSPWAGRGEN